MTNSDLDLILLKAKNGVFPSREELIFLLDRSKPQDIEKLFAAAQCIRNYFFGDTVFLYGFIYFSNHCRNNCRFCQSRQSNTTIDRYRKTQEQVIETAMDLAREGVHLIDLTMGEDPQFYTRDSNGFLTLSELCRKVIRETGLPVMISPGAVPDAVIPDLARQGVSWYACYQETYNQDLFRRLRPGQSFDERIRKKELALENGMLIEEGLLTNVGDTTADVADAIIRMKQMGVDQARVMTFVPQPGTPMADTPAQGSLRELVTISVLRIALPDRLIPASLDVDGLDGLKSRLDAGANVVTSIVPPSRGLVGVANHSLDINDARRSIHKILPVIHDGGLTVAAPELYRRWVTHRQAMNKGRGKN